MGYLLKKSVLVGVLVGALVSIFITVIGAGLVSALIHREFISENSVGYAVMILLMLSAYMGGISACRYVGRKQLVVSMFAGVSYFAVLVAITAMFFDGKYAGIGVTAMVVFCGVGLSALLSKEKKRTGKRLKMKIQSR